MAYSYSTAKVSADRVRRTTQSRFLQWNWRLALALSGNVLGWAAIIAGVKALT